MSAEDTLRALLQTARPLLRGTLRDATVDAIVSDFNEGLLKVLGQAYEVGYREGLAQSPDADLQAGPPPDDDEHVARTGNGAGDDDHPEVAFEENDLEPDDPEPTGIEAATLDPPPLDWGGAAADAGQDDPHPAHSPEGASLRIFPHATVGTLLHRINDYFGLARFDIDVVISRKGDRHRRQLKKSVKLGKYAVGK